MAEDKEKKFHNFFCRIGTNVLDPVIFTGAVISLFPTLFTKRGLRKREMFYYLDLCGAKSFPIVTLICFLMGAVLGMQAALQMRKVGTEIFVADLVGFSLLKELGPLMVGMIATGRAGSAFAAEIGTMKVNEEVSALTTMGISPLIFASLRSIYRLYYSAFSSSVFSTSTALSTMMAMVLSSST